jgi:hypothetical protein
MTPGTDAVEVAPAAASAHAWTAWSVVAAFGAYFCMYAFRQPFKAGDWAEPVVAGVQFKTILVTSQVLGYMLSKFAGIKVVAEMPPSRRAPMILVLIGIAEVALLLFAVVPAPWSALCLFLNGLPLGMVFGLVLGFLEGRRQTEILTAGLCASFILADGVTQSIGAGLLQRGVIPEWMPFTTGVLATPALLLFVWMLARIPPQSRVDIAARATRSTMDGTERRVLYARYALGLSVLVGMYLLVTILRTMRSDFNRQIWQGMGAADVADYFAYSETCVMLGVVAVSGATVMIRDNRRAFFVSLLTCMTGFLLIVATLLALDWGMLSPFAFMVAIGLGLYLPYVAIHTTVFERFLAMTRDRGTICFLMYVADAFGYLGYVAVMLSQHLVAETNNMLDYFIGACWIVASLSLAGMVVAWRYFVRCCRAAHHAEAAR